VKNTKIHLNVKNVQVNINYRIIIVVSKVSGGMEIIV